METPPRPESNRTDAPAAHAALSGSTQQETAPKPESEAEAEAEASLGFERTQRVLEAFVSRYSGVAAQRSEAWTRARQSRVGGSELSVLLGLNPWRSRALMLGQKTGVIGRDAGGVACDWGIFFEPLTESVVSLVHGSPVLGTQIHIDSRRVPGHANSPDGYCVVRLEFPRAALSDHAERQEGPVSAESPAPGRGARILRAGESPARGPAVPAIALLELKAPYRRRPTGRIPSHYMPQLQSGLLLSPPASLGLFVDAAYRLCRLDDLAGGRRADVQAYARDFHGESRPPGSRVCAYGVVLVCRPAAPAPSQGGAGRADHAEAQNGPDAISAAQEPDDLVAKGPVAIEEALSAAARGAGLAVYGKPALRRHVFVPPDGEGSAEPPDETFEEAELPGPPSGLAPVGYLAWKLYDFHVVPVAREPGFADRITPLVARFCADAESIRSAADPCAAFDALCRRQGGGRPATRSEKEVRRGESLMDALYSATAAA